MESNALWCPLPIAPFHMPSGTALVPQKPFKRRKRGNEGSTDKGALYVDHSTASAVHSYALPFIAIFRPNALCIQVHSGPSAWDDEGRGARQRAQRGVQHFPGKSVEMMCQAQTDALRGIRVLFRLVLMAHGRALLSLSDACATKARGLFNFSSPFRCSAMRWGIQGRLMLSVNCCAVCVCCVVAQR
jgi:hypothetical protein